MISRARDLTYHLRLTGVLPILRALIRTGVGPRIFGGDVDAAFEFRPRQLEC
jgi:hypothetical protein